MIEPRREKDMPVYQLELKATLENITLEPIDGALWHLDVESSEGKLVAAIIYN